MNNNNTLLTQNNNNKNNNHQQKNQNTMNNNNNINNQHHSNNFNQHQHDTNHYNSLYNYENDNSPITPFQKFLLNLAGTDLNLIKKCPQSDRNTQIFIGTLLLLFFIYAVWNIHHAFSEMKIFNGWQAWSFAIILALILLNLDRFLISRFIVNPQLGPIKKIFTPYAIIRISLATIIGVFVSIPMILQFNSDAINNAIIDAQQKKLTEINKQDYSNTQISKELNRLKDLKQEKEIKRKHFIAECDSLSKIIKKNQYKMYDEEKQKEIWTLTSTGIMAKNYLNKIQKQILPNIETDIDNLEKQIMAKTQELSSKEQELKNKIETSEKIKEIALTEKLKTMFQLMKNNTYLFLLNLFLTLFFSCIEIVPVALKIVAPSSQYDILQYELLQTNILTSEMRQKKIEMEKKQEVKNLEYHLQQLNLTKEHEIELQKTQSQQELQYQQHIQRLQELRQKLETTIAEINVQFQIEQLKLQKENEIEQLHRQKELDEIIFFINNFNTYKQKLQAENEIAKNKKLYEIEMEKIQTLHDIEMDIQKHKHEMEKIKETELTKAHIEQILTTLEKLSDSYDHILRPDKNNSYIEVISV